MKKISIFQIIIFGIASLAIVGGVIMFASTKSQTDQKAELVTMWGIVDAEVMDKVVNGINIRNSGSINLIYKQFSVDILETELLEALASGAGPDLVLMPLSDVSKHENKLQIIPYESFPERTYKDTFVEGTEPLLKKEGIVAIPYSMDPLVMYWNRTTFTNAGVPRPPVYWDQVAAVVPSLTEKDSEFNVFKSAIALGEFRNIDNAKAILSTLMMQAGTPIITRNVEGDAVSVLGERYGYKIRPAEAAISFYTQFANPVQSLYTWNRSLPSSQDMFISGDLAMYLGFASEYDLIQKRNPNLNFDVAVTPKSRSGTIDVYADINVIAITKQTSNITSAYTAMINLIEKDSLRDLEDAIFLPPLRRDMLEKKPTDDVMSVFYDSVLRSRGVLEYDADKTEEIYKNMVESFISGRVDLNGSVNRANAELDNLIK
jgi:ABC-type glycerol-3-phosphate transport system substrate-binding protein